MNSPAVDLALLRADMQSLREDFDQLANIVAQQAEIIRNFEDERQRRLGAKGAIKVIWATLTAGVAGVAYMMHDIVAFFWPPKH